MRRGREPELPDEESKRGGAVEASPPRQYFPQTMLLLEHAATCLGSNRFLLKPCTNYKPGHWPGQHTLHQAQTSREPTLSSLP